MTRVFEGEELRVAADLVEFLKSHPFPSEWADSMEVKATFYCDGEETGVGVRKDSGGVYVVEVKA